MRNEVLSGPLFNPRFIKDEQEGVVYSYSRRQKFLGLPNPVLSCDLPGTPDLEQQVRATKALTGSKYEYVRLESSRLIRSRNSVFFLRRAPSPSDARPSFPFQELRRRFAAAGSSATAFSVNPGAVRSDIWRFIPKWIAPITDSMMRMLFLNVDEGCCTSVCASALPLESLSGECRTCSVARKPRTPRGL